MTCRLGWLSVAAARALLTGCGTYGDFGRVRPSLVNDDTHVWMGRAAARGRPIRRGGWPYPDRSAYASRLFTTAYRSQTARYNRLIEDLRSDVLRLDPFFVTARYVLDMDRKREKAMNHVTQLTVEERDNTLQRIAQNRKIVLWVHGSLQERVAAYKAALERMVIAAPSPVAVEADRSLTLLQQRISGYGV
jgi:hypothetical protein